MQLLKKAIVILLCLGILCSLVGCISPFTKRHEMPNFDHDEEFLEKKEAWDQKEADLDDSKSLIKDFDFAKYEAKDADWMFCDMNLNSITVEDVLKIENDGIFVCVDNGEERIYDSFEELTFEECKKSDLTLRDIKSVLSEDQTFEIKISKFNKTKAEFVIYFTAPLGTTVKVKECLNYPIAICEWNYEDCNDICSFFGLTDIPVFRGEDPLVLSRVAARTAMRTACQVYGTPTGTYHSSQLEKDLSSPFNLYLHRIFWEKDNYVVCFNIFEENSYQGTYLAKEKRWFVTDFEIIMMDKEHWASTTDNRSYTDDRYFVIF